MKIYVASKFENKPQVNDVMDSLVKRGHSITFDWTIHDAGERQGPELEQYLTHCAEQDYKGVVDCDVFFLIDHPNCKGAYAELGIALALHKRVIVVNAVELKPGMKQNIFMHLPRVAHVTSVTAALMLVDALSHERPVNPS